MYIKDTIYGLATVHGRSGVAIIRISGAQAFDALSALEVTRNIQDREATFCKIYNTFGGGHIQLDECLLLKFSAPHSFTGENVLELHLHGSISVINDTLNALGKIKGFRVAEPGEFSKRAFYNEKLDLTKAEGLALLIDSETTKQREIALRQLSGELEDIYESWRKQIIFAIARIEALIDFPEEDIPRETLVEINSAIKNLAAQIKGHLDTASKGISIMEGIKIPIIGPPNAGKSSLMNKLAGEDIAITSSIAGTTRDVISIKTNIGGYCAILKDTAGIRATENVIEQEGVNRAMHELKNADIAIILLEPNNLHKELIEKLNERCILVINKIDEFGLGKSKVLVEKELLQSENCKNALYISAEDGTNITQVIDAISKRISTNFATGDALITKLRYEEKLQACYSLLVQFSINELLDMAAQTLRLAASCIEEITGKIDIEEIIDTIFSTFCIGK